MKPSSYIDIEARVRVPLSFELEGSVIKVEADRDEPLELIVGGVGEVAAWEQEALS